MKNTILIGTLILVTSSVSLAQHHGGASRAADCATFSGPRDGSWTKSTDRVYFCQLQQGADLRFPIGKNYTTLEEIIYDWFKKVNPLMITEEVARKEMALRVFIAAYENYENTTNDRDYERAGVKERYEIKLKKLEAEYQTYYSVAVRVLAERGLKF